MAISAAARSFYDPRSEPGLELYLDSRFPTGFGGASLNDGDPVGTWTDLSAALRAPNLLTVAEADGTAGWTGSGGTAVLNDATFAKRGTTSIKFTLTTLAGNVRPIMTRRVPVTEGKFYTRLSSVYTTKAYTGGFRAEINWYNAGNTYISTSSGGATTTPIQNAWTSLVTTGIAPPGAVAAEILFSSLTTLTGAAINDDFWFDESGLWEGSSTKFVPPNDVRDASQATAAKKPTWRGGSKNILPVNVATAGALGTTTGFTGYWSTPLAVVNTGQYEGTSAISAAFDRTTTPAQPKNGPVIEPTFMPVVLAGTTFVASAWVKGPAGTTVAIAGRCAATNNATLGESYGFPGQTVLDGTWQRLVTLPFTVSGQDFKPGFQVNVASSSSIQVGTMYIDACQLEIGTAATPWMPPFNSPNGMPVLVFDGVDDFLTSAVVKDGSMPVSVYGVGFNDGSSEAIAEWTQKMRLRWAGTNTVAFDLLDGSGFIGGPSTTATDGVPHVFTGINGPDPSIAVDGGALVTSVRRDAVAGAPVSLTLGQTDGAGSLSGYLAAVLVYDSAHDDPTRRRIERWLGREFGINAG